MGTDATTIKQGIRPEPRHIKTMSATGGIEAWRDFENGLLSPREILALERRVAAVCTGPQSDAEAERDLARLRARWGQAWAEIGQDTPAIQRIAHSGDIRPDDGSRIRWLSNLGPSSHALESNGPASTSPMQSELHEAWTGLAYGCS